MTAVGCQTLTCTLWVRLTLLLSCEKYKKSTPAVGGGGLFLDSFFSCFLLFPLPIAPTLISSCALTQWNRACAPANLPLQRFLTLEVGDFCSVTCLDRPHMSLNGQHTLHSLVYKRLTRSNFSRLPGSTNVVTWALEAACLDLTPGPTTYLLHDPKQLNLLELH